MLNAIIITVVIAISSEVLLEKLNQSKLEPFEKLQAKTRYLRKKKIWQYSLLVIFVIIGAIIGNALKVGHIGTGVLLGFLFALNNTIFESTFFDGLRNTLR